MNLLRLGALGILALGLTACFSTDNGSDTPATYTKSVTVNGIIDIHYAQVDGESGDSIGIGYFLSMVVSFDDREERNPGAYSLGIQNPQDSILQLYYAPGSKEEWARVSALTDSLQVLSDSLLEIAEDSAAGVVGQEIFDLSVAFATNFTRSKTVPISACIFSAQGMTTVDEEEPNTPIPLVVSVHTEDGLSLWIDQQASKPAGKPNFDFVGKPLTGLIQITCPNPLK
jgi:hypothetical protein